MRVYEALAAACRRQGAEVAFGLAGDGNVKFAHHWAKECGGRYIAARHETGAVAMAFGYARSTGRTGLATVTQGPGLTNALTALTAAGRGCEPLVLVTGMPPTGLPGHPQTIDQRALLETAGAGLQDVDPEHVLRDVGRAFERARRERRPVGICVPTDVQDGPGEHVSLAAAAAADWVDQRVADQPAATDPQSIGVAAGLVARAERPLVVAGRGAIASPGARQALEALADRIGALLATTLPIRGFFSGHPWDVGVIGGFSPALTVEEVGRADCVLVFGGSLNYRATRSGSLFGDDAAVIQCDVLEEPPGASVPVDHRIVGDAAVTARALAAELARSGFSGGGARSPALAERLGRGAVHEPYEDLSEEGQVDSRSLMLRLDQLLPPERTVTVDGGHSAGFPSVYLRVPDHRGYLFSLEFAAIGLGLGTAIGAAVGRPDRLSVLVVGDGALLMSLPDLETAARYGIPVVVVVMNDRAYGSELAILDAGNLAPDVGLFENPSFAEVARSMGARGRTIHSLADIEDVAPELERLDGPLLLDCEIHQGLRGPWIKGAFNRSLPAGRR
ncbi:MAG: thiamine pyrophosphate-binding protein [Nitriliruptorales bacterium]|nr:thiamine pyrophosphate-binding protein [Nitriliruptorales bacterium]